MGIKMRPITERVNSGLFNQKKADKFSNQGVREPLLNVGPAGVYGDNITHDSPSPAKKKESAAQERKNLMDDMPVDRIASGAKKKSVTANSPLKKDPPVSAGDIVTGSVKNTVVDPEVTPGGLLPKEPSTNRVEPGSEEEAFYIKNKKRCDQLTNDQKLDPANKCTGFAQKKAPDVEKCPEGSTKNADGECIKSESSLKGQTVRNQGEFAKPWESRQNERNRKFWDNRAERSLKSQTNLKNKLAGFKDKTGKVYGEKGFQAPKPGQKGYKRFNNLEQRLGNANRDYAARNQGRNNAERQIEQNLTGKGQGVSGVFLNENDEQTARTSQIDGRGGPNSITKADILTKSEFGGVGKKVSNFFKKKSPMKSKYFK